MLHVFVSTPQRCKSPRGLSMKVGTISLNINTDDFNYGAILHSWAMQQWLLRQSFVVDSEIIDYTTPSAEYFNRYLPALSMLRVKRPRAAMRYILHSKPYKQKLSKFDSFIDKEIRKSDQKYTQTTLQTAILPYDTILCESDVIWSPGFFGGKLDPAFFMAMQSMEQMHKIAYAPSLADGNLSKDQGETLKEYLKSVDSISCRESYSVDILKKYTDKDVVQVVDPVLLLHATDYERITRDNQESEPYLLMYLPMDDNKELRDAAQRYANEKGLIVIEIDTQLKEKGRGIVNIMNAGVEDFLTYIKHADVIFTNSFHAICFALLFQREFYAFTRGSSGKVRDLCESVGLSRRFFPDNFFKPQDSINYHQINKTIENKRRFSSNWLACSLRGNTGGIFGSL